MLNLCVCQSRLYDGLVMYLHELLLGALWADDVLSVGDEAFAHEGGLALSTNEAVVVPVTVFERDEASAADTSDRLGARRAPLSEELSEAFSAVRLLVAGSEPLSGQRSVAVGASKALPMPRLILVCYATLRDDLIALDATSSELVFVTAGAVDFLLTWDEAPGTDGVLAYYAAEALLVPLPGLVFHFLGASAEHFTASITATGELSIVTVAAVDLVKLGAELLVYERDAALGAKEACLMPMLVLVRQVLGVNADGLVAFFAAVGEDAFVTLDAVGVFVTKHIALTGERLVALPAAEVAAMPVLVHRLGVLATENKLITCMTSGFQPFSIMSYTI